MVKLVVGRCEIREHSEMVEGEGRALQPGDTSIR